MCQAGMAAPNMLFCFSAFPQPHLLHLLLSFSPHTPHPLLFVHRKELLSKFSWFSLSLFVLPKWALLAEEDDNFPWKPVENEAGSKNLPTYTWGILVPVVFISEMGTQTQRQITFLVSSGIESRKLRAWMSACCLSHSSFLAFLVRFDWIFETFGFFSLQYMLQPVLWLFYVSDKHSPMKNKFTHCFTNN